MLPKIQAMFRLTREPELKYAQSGTALCKVGLAASEKYKDKETQLFIDGTAFGKTAEMLNNVQKGHRVLVTGKINTESWQGQDGQKHSKTVMSIESFEFVEKREGERQPQQQYDHTAYQTPQNYGNQQMPTNNITGIDIDEDEIPFGYIGLQYPRSLYVI